MGNITRYFKSGYGKHVKRRIPRRKNSNIYDKANVTNRKLGYQHGRPQITLDNAIKTKNQRRKKRFGVF